MLKNNNYSNRIYTIFIILIIIYLLYFIKKVFELKEHYTYGSYEYIAKHGKVKGKDLPNNVGMSAAGVVYGIYQMFDLVDYLIVDMPNEILELSDGGSSDPIGQIFG